ncbi:unnamed protein product [Macrosiphum euphorbiae]|uniref:Uncharacterized protein n=1 Tax=Macrosiphum euphorbiae TaxID=13131 RepID=A0AAV0VV18_9HEMI|nr:unnamed protein product [Macrosiphum euphorbiae]
MSSELGGSDGGKTTVVEDNKSTESPRPQGILEEMEKIKDDFRIRAFIIFSNSNGQAKEKTVTFPLFYGLAYYTCIEIQPMSFVVLSIDKNASRSSVKSNTPMVITYYI